MLRVEQKSFGAHILSHNSPVCCCKNFPLTFISKSSPLVYPQRSLSVRVKQGFRLGPLGMHLAKVAAAPMLVGSGCGSRWPVSVHQAVWTINHCRPCSGEAPKSSHTSLDFKIAPCVKRALDNAAQKCELCVTEVCGKLMKWRGWKEWQNWSFHIVTH